MTAWETTTEDVKRVLDAHGVEVSEERLEEIHDSLDHDAIENGVLYYTSMDAQTDSMLDDIETQLMESGVVPKGEKKFVMQDEDEYEDDDFGEEEWDDDDDFEEDDFDDED